jgi:hypothetical protein
MGTGTSGSGMTGSGTTGSGTSGTGTGSSGMGTGDTSSGGPSQAHTPAFNASNYKTMTECLNAAQAAGASRDACSGLK